METGLYYYGARYLDAKTSRWLSTDPALGEYVPGAGGDNSQLPGMGGIYNYVNMHLYHYGANNPIKYLDPDGRFFKFDSHMQKLWDNHIAGTNFGNTVNDAHGGWYRIDTQSHLFANHLPRAENYGSYGTFLPRGFPDFGLEIGISDQYSGFDEMEVLGFVHELQHYIDYNKGMDTRTKEYNGFKSMFEFAGAKDKSAISDGKDATWLNSLLIVTPVDIISSWKEYDLNKGWDEQSAEFHSKYNSFIDDYVNNSYIEN